MYYARGRSLAAAGHLGDSGLQKVTPAECGYWVRRRFEPPIPTVGAPTFLMMIALLHAVGGEDLIEGSVTLLRTWF